MLVSAVFTIDGLSPLVRIRDMSDGSVVISGSTMFGIGDGFYTYDFVAYDDDIDYAIFCDGGSTLSGTDRYSYGTSEDSGTVVKIKSDLDNPDQYKADVSGLASANEYDSTLSGIQNEVSGLDGEAMRGTDGAYTGTPPTVSEIDTELSTSHGVGSWTTGSGLTEQNLHDGLDSYSNKSDYKATGFSITGEYDAVLSGIQLDLDNPDQYKADVSGLALESTVNIIGTTLDDIDVRTILIRKIQTNRLELQDGSTSNWALYDDDDSVLLTFSITDKNGNSILQPDFAPSRRSKGV